MSITMWEPNIEEDNSADVYCIACHGQARYGMAVPIRYLEVALECEECEVELVRWGLG